MSLTIYRGDDGVSSVKLEGPFSTSLFEIDSKRLIEHLAHEKNNKIKVDIFYQLLGRLRSANELSPELRDRAIQIAYRYIEPQQPKKLRKIAEKFLRATRCISDEKRVEAYVRAYQRFELKNEILPPPEDYIYRPDIYQKSGTGDEPLIVRGIQQKFAGYFTAGVGACGYGLSRLIELNHHYGMPLMFNGQAGTGVDRRNFPLIDSNTVVEQVVNKALEFRRGTRTEFLFGGAHSGGIYPTLLAALDNPGLFDALILFSPVRKVAKLSNRMKLEGFTWAHSQFPRLKEAIENLQFPVPMPKASHNRFRRKNPRPYNLPGKVYSNYAELMRAALPRLHELKIPVFIGQGSKDFALPKDNLQYLARKMTNSKVTPRVYKSLGHELILDDLKKEVISDVRDFLENSIPEDVLQKAFKSVEVERDYQSAFR